MRPFDQGAAASGRLMMGSSCTLKLILINTGTRGARSKFAQDRRRHRIVGVANDLRTRRIVNMHNRRNAAAPTSLRK